MNVWYVVIVILDGKEFPPFVLECVFCIIVKIISCNIGVSSQAIKQFIYITNSFVTGCLGGKFVFINIWCRGCDFKCGRQFFDREEELHGINLVCKVTQDNSLLKKKKKKKRKKKKKKVAGGQR
eukprot:TRINITY_DN24847_c0_g3_i1.p5 TRINITY_DN24847_c0_g3~~TRINITY_DN24847_c0_g3_i1.p5  ORF type:complete len:124 (+),score=13.82 TRINITY_DN24847_c0_g3_i1:900-1271(+)